MRVHKCKLLLTLCALSAERFREVPVRAGDRQGPQSKSFQQAARVVGRSESKVGSEWLSVKPVRGWEPG